MHEPSPPLRALGQLAFAPSAPAARRYVPFLAGIFSIVPLSFSDWMLVLAFSSPVILIDEVLKCVGRMRNAAERTARISAGATGKKGD